MPSSYRAGKLPKAFKIIPSLSNWEEVPSPFSSHPLDPLDHRAAELVAAGDVCRHAHLRLQPERQAGAAFLLLGAPPRGSRQYSAVQVDAARGNELQEAELPLLPVAEEGDVQARRVLQGHSAPALRGSAARGEGWAVGRVHAEGGDHREFGGGEGVDSDGAFGGGAAEVDSVAVDFWSGLNGRYSGAVSLFMMVLLNKKYSLPYVVIDALVDYFRMFDSDDRELPVLWQQVESGGDWRCSRC